MEDGNSGLEVCGKKLAEPDNSLWMAYGDGYLFADKSKENHERVLSAVQQAVKEVYQAFITQKILPAEESKINELLPTVTQNNFPPLFKVDESGKVVCRIPLPLTNQEKVSYTRLDELTAIKILSHYSIVYKEKHVQQTIEAALNHLKQKYKLKEKMSFSFFKSSDKNEIMDEYRSINDCKKF